MIQKAYWAFFGYLNLSGGKLFSLGVGKCFLFFLVNFPKLPETASRQSTTDRCRGFGFRQAKLMDLKRREDLKDALVEKFKAPW